MSNLKTNLVSETVIINAGTHKGRYAEIRTVSTDSYGDLRYTLCLNTGQLVSTDNLILIDKNTWVEDSEEKDAKIEHDG